MSIRELCHLGRSMLVTLVWQVEENLGFKKQLLMKELNWFHRIFAEINGLQLRVDLLWLFYGFQLFLKLAEKVFLSKKTQCSA